MKQLTNTTECEWADTLAHQHTQTHHDAAAAASHTHSRSHLAIQSVMHLDLDVAHDSTTCTYLGSVTKNKSCYSHEIASVVVRITPRNE